MTETLLNYGIAGAMLLWFAFRLERRVETLSREIRLNTLIVAKAHEIDLDAFIQLERAANGQK